MQFDICICYDAGNMAAVPIHLSDILDAGKSVKHIRESDGGYAPRVTTASQGNVSTFLRQVVDETRDNFGTFEEREIPWVFL